MGGSGTDRASGSRARPSGLPRLRRLASGSTGRLRRPSSSGPAGRPARSACQSAVRRSPPNDASAPISASVRTSSCRSPARATRSSIDGNRSAVRPRHRPSRPDVRSIRCPASSLSPLTYRSPSRTAPSSCTTQSQSRDLHVDRREAHAAPLRVLDERRRMVEPHRLVVEERRVERRRKMRLEIRARVDDAARSWPRAIPEIRRAQTT